MRRFARGRHARALALLPVFLLLGTTTPEDPVDFVAYTHEMPHFFPSTTGQQVPFESPFADNPLPVDDGATRFRVVETTGVALPRGTAPWGHVSWSKYVVVGNYDERNAGFGQTIEDQRIGVYDTEARTYCQIDLTPGESNNASVQWLAVASPDAAQTRIYFAGITFSTGYTFGYLEADSTSADPCDPDTGWNVFGFSAQQLNCRAGDEEPDCSDDTIPDDEQPCVLACLWDGMELLDAETVVLGNWGGQRYAVLRVDADDGELTVPAVYKLPYWQPTNAGGICYNLNPVTRPEVDRTRGPDDRRWVGAFDVYCDTPLDAPGCAPPQKFVCPYDQFTNCPASEQCVKSTCDILSPLGWLECDSTEDCFGVFGECTPECRGVHPGRVCIGGALTTGFHCYKDSDCWGLGAKCGCGIPGNPPVSLGAPIQEYSFDGEDITPTSRLFQPAAGAALAELTYDSNGSLWVKRDASIQTYVSVFGLHSYDDDSDPAGVAIVPTNQTIMTLDNWNFLNYPTTALQATGAMYFASRVTLQRAQSGYGSWFKDTAFNHSLGNRLPTEARVCRPGTPTSCVSDLECDGGETCEIDVAPGTPQQKSNLTIGGAPPSLWMMVGFQASAVPRTVKNLYLVRAPLATALPDPVVDHRPAIAWNGGDCTSHPRQCRLWAVAPKGGAMKFRARDDGFWSGWHALPAGSVGMGPAIIATGSTIEVFARASDRTVMRTQLTSSEQCEPAACTWSAWEMLPASPWTDNDIAAAYGDGKKLVAMRRAYDGLVHVTLDSGSGWSPWVGLPGVPTGAAPSVTYHDGKFWIAASRSVLATIHVTQYDGTAPQSWLEVSGTGSQAPWLTAPAIASDGERIHLYAGKSGFPNIYHAIDNGAGFGAWRIFATRPSSAWQPAAANVNGEVHLVTSWAGPAGMSELASD